MDIKWKNRQFLWSDTVSLGKKYGIWDSQVFPFPPLMGPRTAEAQLTVNNIYFYGSLGQYLFCTYLFINYNVHTSVFLFSLSCTES